MYKLQKITLLLTLLITSLFSEVNQLNTAIDNIVLTHNEKLQSKKIIISIMDSKSGNILYINNKNIAASFLYEPGSVMIPISISMAIDMNKIQLDNKHYYSNIRFKHKTIKLSPKKIVIDSKNIESSLIAQMISGKEFYYGYKAFGFSKKTGIDIKNEVNGNIPKLYSYTRKECCTKNMFRATTSYGYGMTATHLQLLKAYTVFNNDGRITTPKLDKIKIIPYQKSIIQHSTTTIMKEFLIANIKNKIEKNNISNSLQFGGKEASANIFENGKDSKKYINSFFGFVNDKKGNKYSIGITVIEPLIAKQKSNNSYSNPIISIFEEVINTMVGLKLLKTI
ncbi:MAG: penicillin-binding transpeptidase domain-containing protein [Campylobacterota bacterium]|nr:penicillin-binding transpeptidase domain-containing protein [Campylobacterota bacterium]